MRLPTTTLGLLCILLGSGTTLAVPTPHLSERSFNPRQKWESNEENCVRVFNPAAGSTFHPGYFVRMSYGTEQCGVAAAKPWTIHLYNNPEIKSDGEINYDYHEVIASGVNEKSSQYLWNIQQTSSRRVKKINEYYVRVETSSEDGTKLVGNAGPFSISPTQVSKREDTINANILNTEAAPHVNVVPLEETAIAPKVDETPLGEQAIAPESPSTFADAPAVDSKLVTVNTDNVVDPGFNGQSILDAPPPPAPKPPITEISRESFIPNKLLVGVAVAGGALGLGYLGGSYFSQAGAVLGAVIGGVIGGVVVLLSFLNPLSY